MNNNNRIVSIIRETIPYVKQFRPFTESVTAAILMQQLEYWFDKFPDGFYKFSRPAPDNDKYREDDSWTEELNFSYEEFTNAFNRIGLGHKSKGLFEATPNPFVLFDSEREGKIQIMFYCYYYDRGTGLTHYHRNHKLTNLILNIITQTPMESTKKHQELMTEAVKDIVSSEIKDSLPTSTKLIKIGQFEIPFIEPQKYAVNRECQFTEIGSVNLQKSTQPISVNRECQFTEIGSVNISKPSSPGPSRAGGLPRDYSRDYTKTTTEDNARFAKRSNEAQQQGDLFNLEIMGGQPSEVKKTTKEKSKPKNKKGQNESSEKIVDSRVTPLIKHYHTTFVTLFNREPPVTKKTYGIFGKAINNLKSEEYPVEYLKTLMDMWFSRRNEKWLFKTGKMMDFIEALTELVINEQTGHLPNNQPRYNQQPNRTSLQAPAQHWPKPHTPVPTAEIQIKSELPVIQEQAKEARDKILRYSTILRLEGKKETLLNELAQTRQIDSLEALSEYRERVDRVYLCILDLIRQNQEIIKQFNQKAQAR